MSKSKGEFLTIDTLAREGYDPLDYRYFLLTAHYRGEIKFSYENLGAARTALAGLRERVLDWRSKGQLLLQFSATGEALRQRFLEAVADDLHMPRALTILWEVAKHDDLSDSEKLTLVYEFDEIFGLNLSTHERRELSAEQRQLLDRRAQARAAKNWAESDRLRDELLKLGVQVKDSRDGTEWMWVV